MSEMTRPAGGKPAIYRFRDELARVQRLVADLQKLLSSAEAIRRAPR